MDSINEQRCPLCGLEYDTEKGEYQCGRLDHPGAGTVIQCGNAEEIAIERGEKIEELKARIENAMARIDEVFEWKEDKISE